MVKYPVFTSWRHPRLIQPEIGGVRRRRQPDSLGVTYKGIKENYVEEVFCT